ncbi:MAG TPA: YdeI/OmpD-associated family protein [Puia sp.]|nr:YdeI/OmpD-associated family protein [Puia sp.]
MPTTDPRVDAYIAKSADFARPILSHLRQLVHKACPSALETIKWGMPFFESGGALLCNMAAFKHHCAFGFWNAPLLKDPKGALKVRNRESMGHFEKITALKDLPADATILALIREAARLNEQGIKKPVPKKEPKPELPVPAALTAALRKNKKAKAWFGESAPSHRREYIEWITGAKTEPTRDKRIATAVEWMSEGKSRNWQYKKN